MEPPKSLLIVVYYCAEAGRWVFGGAYATLYFQLHDQVTLMPRLGLIVVSVAMLGLIFWLLAELQKLTGGDPLENDNLSPGRYHTDSRRR